MPEQLASVWQGTFKLLGVDITCHVLNNGQRVIEEQSMRDLFEAMNKDSLEERVDCSNELLEFVGWIKGIGKPSERE